MDSIRQTARRLCREYALLWIGVAAEAAAGEWNLLPCGRYAGQVGAEYVLETVGILLVIGGIPLSLKAFRLALERRVRPLPLAQALRAYCRWSRMRLGILFWTAAVNVAIYYLTWNSIGGLCALMALTASLFCWPSERRLRVELDLEAA